jgi:spore maturation protein SpmA
MNILKTCPGSKRSQAGSAVAVMLGLVGIMAVFASLNTIAIRSLQRELKQVEKMQVHRLQTAQPVSTAR